MVNDPEACASTPDDAELMRRVVGGDEAAFTQLVHRWELPVKAVIARVVLNAEEARDLAQETFVRVWTHRCRFDPSRPVKPWILGIAMNQARNRLRWWRRRPSVSLEEWMETGPLAQAQAQSPSGAQQAERGELAEAILAAVAQLPVPLRTALVLFEYERLSQAEIAQVEGITPKAVEKRVARAREELRRDLRQRGFGC